MGELVSEDLPTELLPDFDREGLAEEVAILEMGTLLPFGTSVAELDEMESRVFKMRAVKALCFGCSAAERFIPILSLIVNDLRLVPIAQYIVENTPLYVETALQLCWQYVLENQLPVSKPLTLLQQLIASPPIENVKEKTSWLQVSAMEAVYVVKSLLEFATEPIDTLAVVESIESIDFVLNCIDPDKKYVSGRDWAENGWYTSPSWAKIHWTKYQKQRNDIERLKSQPFNIQLVEQIRSESKEMGQFYLTLVQQYLE